MWDDQCKESFEVLKTFLTSPPILARALSREALEVYISASNGSVASVLVKDVEGREAPVYYVSHTLKDAETRYPHVEKLVYALAITSRNLRHCFQGRPIKVMTNQPLKRILHRPDMTGRLAAWTVKLSQFHIKYLSHSAIKSQILSVFVVECNFDTSTTEKTLFPQKACTLYVDGSSTTSSGGAAEYEALLTGIRLAIELEVKVLEIFGDSQLVTKQLEDNQWADALSKLASSVAATSEGIYVEERNASFIDMDTPSVDMLKVNEISSIADWRQPILKYILQNKLPQDKGEARAISYMARNYYVLENKLYRRGLVEPLLRCLGPEESHTSIIEVHTGICGDHLGGKNLALKIMR
ncbi:uncharacterized protein LOC141702065 [Apium graveolens]|uniref:uncharacterized protein LOC141702065 n=1 Tax=Apium graveolens TaxID=4045 RepID=UPI003D7B0B25